LAFGSITLWLSLLKHLTLLPVKYTFCCCLFAFVTFSGLCGVVVLSGAGLVDYDKVMTVSTSLHLTSLQELQEYEAGRDDDKLHRLLRSICYQGNLLEESRTQLAKGVQVKIEYDHAERTAKVSHIHSNAVTTRTLSWGLPLYPS
jgi:hypothetical protein